MQIFDYNELTQNVSKVFDVALLDEVIVNNKIPRSRAAGYSTRKRNKNGYSYKILPFKNNNAQEKSPLEDIPCIEADITTQEIVELLRESRAGI
jgi:hypothetical protein